MVIHRMLQQGVLDRVSRGVYVMSGVDDGTNENLFKTATIRCGRPSAVCLLSALEYHHLTDEISHQVWILVPTEKRVRAKELKLIRSRKPKWNLGIKKMDGYWITTVERTLIDCLLFKNLLGLQTALAALNRAVEENRIRMGDVFDLAKKMRVLDKLRPYLEARSV